MNYKEKLFRCGFIVTETPLYLEFTNKGITYHVNKKTGVWHEIGWHKGNGTSFSELLLKLGAYFSNDKEHIRVARYEGGFCGKEDL